MEFLAHNFHLVVVNANIVIMITFILPHKRCYYFAKCFLPTHRFICFKEGGLKYKMWENSWEIWLQVKFSTRGIEVYQKKVIKNFLIWCWITKYCWSYGRKMQDNFSLVGKKREMWNILIFVRILKKNLSMGGGQCPHSVNSLRPPTKSAP